MNEYMYSINNYLIALVLLVSMVSSIQAGRYIGAIVRSEAPASFSAHVNGLQASLLGILALLLGFTFSLALQRFDSRSAAVVEEANAIGTTFLRARLLPDDLQAEVLPVLQRYVDLRARTSQISVIERSTRAMLLAQSDVLIEQLWSLAERAAQEDGSPVRAGLFVQSLNDAIDAFSHRDAELRRHVPEVVLFLLYGSFLLTSGIVGYAAGIGGHQPSAATYALVVLIVLLTFIIVDLDHPRRGLIKVDQTSILKVQQQIDSWNASQR